MRPGRHGSMSSSELENIIARNGNLLSVRRAGSGDGYAALYNAITGDFILGINGGQLPEYSRMQNPKWGCDCTPRGHCKTGMHGTNLLRGWRNILYELLARNRITSTREIRKVLGEQEARDAHDYGQVSAPMFDPNGKWEYSGVTTNASQ